MRVLVFHGYLLRGTGSNVYNARLCAALARAGHSVDLLCQEPRPEELDFVDAVGTWEDGVARVQTLREPVRVTVWRPDIGRLLPVYVADRYEGFEARPLLECSDAEIEAYVQANVAAVRDVCARARPDVALANHLVMGPAIVARGLGGDVPYAVKVHGSALEYVVKRDPARFLPWAREGLAGRARRARRLAPHRRVAVRGDAGRRPARAHPAGPAGRRRRRVPPARRRRRRRRGADRAAGGQRGRRRRGRLRPRRERGRERAAQAGSRPRPPRVLHRQAHRLQGHRPAAGGVAAGSRGPPGGHRLRRLPRRPGGPAGRARRRRPRGACARSRRPGASSRAARERRCAICWPSSRPPTRSTGPRRATCASASCSPGAWSTTSWRRCWPAARRSSSRAPSPRPTGWWPPRRRPAACCPSRPGTRARRRSARCWRPPCRRPARGWLSFPIDDGAVRAIAERVTAWLRAPDELRAATRAALVATAHARFSWEGVAGGVIAAAQGHLAELPPVA